MRPVSVFANGPAREIEQLEEAGVARAAQTTSCTSIM
jgi:hypothetical protein